MMPTRTFFSDLSWITSKKNPFWDQVGNRRSLEHCCIHTSSPSIIKTYDMVSVSQPPLWTPPRPPCLRSYDWSIANISSWTNSKNSEPIILLLPLSQLTIVVAQGVISGTETDGRRIVCCIVFAGILFICQALPEFGSWGYYGMCSCFYIMIMGARSRSLRT